MSADSPFAHLVFQLQQMAEEGRSLYGDELLSALGGAADVYAAASTFTPGLDSIAEPTIHDANEALSMDYGHLPTLARFLMRESSAAVAGRAFMWRTEIWNKHLTLFTRRAANDDLPCKIIWLDATANAHLYKTAFQRATSVWEHAPQLAGKIYQICDSAFGKSTLFDRESGAPTHRIARIETMVGHLVKTHDYKAPAIISFKKMAEVSAFVRDMSHGHFYAARGTNAFERADALFVVGTPSPDLLSMERLGRCLFSKREDPFNARWTCRNLAYPYSIHDEDSLSVYDEARKCSRPGKVGEGVSYPVSGFWHDHDLQAILESVRDAELVQAAHRARPLHRATDIWLVENIPIAELPLTRLLTVNMAMGAPPGVDSYRWPEVLQLARELGVITSADLADFFDISADTAVRWLNAILTYHGDEFERVAAVARRGRGRPLRAIGRKPLIM
jgi:hypothetical protein